MGVNHQPSRLFRFGIFGSVCLLLSFQVVRMASVRNDASIIIDEVKRTLAGHSDMSMVTRYLEMSKDELTAILSQGEPEGYTFFAPENWAFIRMLPQDTADPFFVDAELRRSVLLHHFAKRVLSPNDLSASSEILMADGKPSKVTRAAVKTGLGKINDAKIEGQPIPLAGNLGNVYIVDRVFTTREEIEKSLRKHPPKETPWGPIESPAAQSEVESQTVVIDLLEEFFADPDNAGLHQ